MMPMVPVKGSIRALYDAAGSFYGIYKGST